MSILSGCEPESVFGFFEEICRIPHGSGNIERISNYLMEFAKERKLRCRQDELKNVIIWKDGSKGYEGAVPVIIQGHMDMVAVKTDDCSKDVANEGPEPQIVEKDWLSAKGTSLGGDNGIAVAYALALLDSDTIPHPPLEVILTVDEEIGMLGAAGLDLSDIKGRMMLNMDSEEEGIFTVSCAGGLTACCKIPYGTEEKDGVVLTIGLNGFKGGHSGTEIDKGRLNANLTMGRLLNSIRDPKLRLIAVNGGEKDNAIAKFCEASVLLPGSRVDGALAALTAEFELIKEEYVSVETSLNAYHELMQAEKMICMDADSTERIITILMNIPNGVQRMNPDMSDMVQTSLNLGIVATEAHTVTLTSALRSASESEKTYLLARVKAFIGLAGGTTEVFGDYPGWEYRAESKLRDTMIRVYSEQYGRAPLVQGVHAGLECGIFSSKIEDLDCISFGPQMEDVHTTDERLSISSVARTWELLKNTLKNLNEPLRK